MKSVFITYDQAHHENVLDALSESNVRGYTFFEGVGGRGTTTGEPHLGSHAWPTMNSAIFAVIRDEQVQSLLDRLHQFDLENPLLGIRAFVWNIEQSI